MTTITALPSPPSRQDPTNFNDRADAFLGALPAFATEANAQAVEVNTASANAVAANQAVIAATNITKWVSGTTYAQGAVVWSPINGLAYRRITASGSGTTDPSADTTNYKQVNGTGDVSTSGDQTISGIKTFNTPIAVSSGGTGASTASAAFDNLKQPAQEYYAGVVAIASTSQAQQYLENFAAITPRTFKDGLNASGSAPVYAARAWVNFNGAPTSGTYGRSGTTVTVNMTGHGMITGQTANLTFSTGTGGTATSGSYSITKIDNNTFTITDTVSGTITGSPAVTRNIHIRGSGNVSSITDNGVGNYTVNFTTAMPDANYVVVGTGSGGSGTGASGVVVLAEALATTNSYSSKTASAVQVVSTNNDSDSLNDAFSANIVIFR